MSGISLVVYQDGGGVAILTASSGSGLGRLIVGSIAGATVVPFLLWRESDAAYRALMRRGYYGQAAAWRALPVYFLLVAVSFLVAILGGPASPGVAARVAAALSVGLAAAALLATTLLARPRVLIGPAVRRTPPLVSVVCGASQRARRAAEAAAVVGGCVSALVAFGAGGSDLVAGVVASLLVCHLPLIVVGVATRRPTVRRIQERMGWRGDTDDVALGDEPGGAL